MFYHVMYLVDPQFEEGTMHGLRELDHIWKGSVCIEKRC